MPTQRLSHTLRGALAGTLAAGVWAAQQPLDKRLTGVDYDDCELLGSAVTRGRYAYPAGVAMHLANGAIFGALYSRVAPSLPGPRAARGLAAGLVEGVGMWPLSRFVGLHPEGGRFPQLWGDRRAFGQMVWRHALFGVVLGELEGRLNPAPAEAEVTEESVVSTNGHGDVENLVVVGTA